MVAQAGEPQGSPVYSLRWVAGLPIPSWATTLLAEGSLQYRPNWRPFMANFVTGTSALIPIFTGNLSHSTVRLCAAYTLHAFLPVKREAASLNGGAA